MRSNEAILIVGRKHTGKSTLLNRIAKGVSGPFKRTLIINVNGSPAYNEHKQIGYPQLKQYRSGGVYQFYDPDHDRMFEFLTEHFGPQYDEAGNKTGERPFHGSMFFEDCTKYIPANPQKKIKTFLVDHRMWDADLYFTFHSLKRVPPFFWDLITRVIILKTQDTESQLQRLDMPNQAEIIAAHKRVMASSDNYNHEVVDTLI